mgnify:CR=1 FL=1|jgi:hypothetical protein
MKHNLIKILIAIAGGAVFGALVYAVLVVTQLAEPAGTTIAGPTARRLWATLAAVLALAGTITGGLALTKPSSRFASARWAMRSLGLGLIGLINGALNLALATGGPGTGNGVVGGAAAVVLGAAAIALGGLTLARGRGMAFTFRQEG